MCRVHLFLWARKFSFHITMLWLKGSRHQGKNTQTKMHPVLFFEIFEEKFYHVQNHLFCKMYFCLFDWFPFSTKLWNCGVMPLLFCFNLYGLRMCAKKRHPTHSKKHKMCMSFFICLRILFIRIVFKMLFTKYVISVMAESSETAFFAPAPDGLQAPAEWNFFASGLTAEDAHLQCRAPVEVCLTLLINGLLSFLRFRDQTISKWRKLAPFYDHWGNKA